MRINPLKPLDNFKIVSEIRCELARKLDIGTLQRVLAGYWKPWFKDSHVLMSDAICYESDLRFPTDIKLLWECSEWLQGQLRSMAKLSGLRMPRNKFDKQCLRYRIYSKKRRRGKSETRVMKRSLLHLVGKLIGQCGISCPLAGPISLAAFTDGCPPSKKYSISNGNVLPGGK